MRFIPLVFVAALGSISTVTLAGECTCCYLTLSQMANKLQNNEISSTQCTTELIQYSSYYRTAQSNYHLFTQLDTKGALLQAVQADARRKQHKELGSLDGIPIVIKDNIDVLGFNTTAGTPSFQKNQAKQSAVLVQTLQQNGMIVLGKTNMHELAAGVTSNNYFYGAVWNPYDCKKFAGGSSGGSAAAVALGIIPVAVGTDTAGSTRIPAALSGVVGFRPTIGRYSTNGVVPVSHTLDTMGLFARSVNDLYLLDQIITSEKIKPAYVQLSKVRLGVARSYYYKNMDPETGVIVNQFLKRLQQQGVTLVEIDIPSLDALLKKTAFPIAFYEVIENMEKYLKVRMPKLSFAAVVHQIASPDVKAAFTEALNNPISRMNYLNALQVSRPKLQRLFAEYFNKNHLDGMIFPTTLLPARDIVDSLYQVKLNGQSFSTVEIYAHNTMPGANAGLPGISLPIGYTRQNLPVGIEIDAPSKADVKLLQLAAAIQQKTGISLHKVTGMSKCTTK